MYIFLLEVPVPISFRSTVTSLNHIFLRLLLSLLPPGYLLHIIPKNFLPCLLYACSNHPILEVLNYTNNLWAPNGILRLGFLKFIIDQVNSNMATYDVLVCSLPITDS